MSALTRISEYRRILASLPDESVGVAVACFMLSSLPQKHRWSQAMAKFEQEPGFAGWGTVKDRPEAGNPAVTIAMPAPRRSPARKDQR